MAAPVINPYAGVDFGAVTARPGVTHMHGSVQSDLDIFYAAGVRVMAFSRYYPSAPFTPGNFTSIPADVVMLDNSEQHSATDSSLHYCAVGSTQTRGVAGGTHPAPGDFLAVPWRDAFTEEFATLDLADGGGITINHPIWSGLNDAEIIGFLDFDPRVLGIEIYNHMTNTLPIYQAWQQKPAWPLWDRLLATGRRCWGFMAHDHYGPEIAPYLGFNMLLMDALTAASALRAYRTGKFYTTMNPPGANHLALTGFTVADHAVTVTTDAATSLRMVTDLGVVDAAGPSTTFTVPAGAIYARFEATGLGDTLRTQPLMYRVTPPVVTDGAALQRRRYMRGID